MLEGAGFEVDRPRHQHAVDKFLAALEEHQPDILGMSALLTTTMPYMKVVIDTLQGEGPARRVHRARRRRAAERGVRPGDRRRRLLPRRGRRGRDRQALVCAAGRRKGVVREPSTPELARDRGRVRVATGPTCWSSRAAPSRASCSPCSGLERAGRTSRCATFRRTSTTGPSGSPAPSTRSSTSSTGPHERVFVGYADCGTGGALDAVLAERPRTCERLPGDHCYELLRRHDALGRDAGGGGRHVLPHRLPRQALRGARLAGPQLDRTRSCVQAYFGNYTRVLLPRRPTTPSLRERARGRAPRSAGSPSRSAARATASSSPSLDTVRRTMHARDA